MRPEIEEYVKQKEAEAKRETEEKELARRNKILIAAGFYQKEYQQFENNSGCYPCWDPERSLYYRPVAIQVTDEEFHEIEKYAQKEKTVAAEANVGKKIMSYAKVVCALGITASVISGITLMYVDEEWFFWGLLTAVCGSLGAWISSWFTYAFGQIADDVHVMRKKAEED